MLDLELMIKNPKLLYKILSFININLNIKTNKLNKKLKKWDSYFSWGKFSN